MSFRKIGTSAVSEEPVGALLEVRPGQAEGSVVAWLRAQGATEIRALAPGFLSVVATPATLRAAEGMARVEIKRRKAMHAPVRR